MTVKGPDWETVKKEHAEFIKDPARRLKYVDEALRHGWFVTLDQGRIKGAFGHAFFQHEYRRYYEMLSGVIKKGESHTAHVAGALKRLAATAQRGSVRLKVAGVSMTGDDAAFQKDLLIFQGWLASLMEVYVTLFGFIEGSNGASRKVQELAAACQALINTRVSERGGTASHPELFKAMLEL